MNAEAIFIIDGRRYRWSGWLGCQLESIERRRLRAGDVRHILERNFHVFSVRRVGLWRFRTAWALALPKDLAAANIELHALKSDLRALI